ncbi:hypothetical protein SAMN03080615_02800 [Amphritea atlantica]|uniref:Uncharacterized protein n=1 Tax=Amphritea atlantica TaxID=355243 RepID=A0A1H9J0Y0_9GAMM|nr:hypothetical protein SAMN03080615_02800 [Amphritea atlantica]
MYPESGRNDITEVAQSCPQCARYLLGFGKAAAPIHFDFVVAAGTLGKFVNQPLGRANLSIASTQGFKGNPLEGFCLSGWHAQLFAQDNRMINMHI